MSENDISMPNCHPLWWANRGESARPKARTRYWYALPPKHISGTSCDGERVCVFQIARDHQSSDLVWDMTCLKRAFWTTVWLSGSVNLDLKRTQPLSQEHWSTAVEPGLFVSRRDHLDGLLPQESAHFLFHYQGLLGTHQRGSDPVERWQQSAAIACSTVCMTQWDTFGSSLHAAK